MKMKEFGRGHTSLAHPLRYLLSTQDQGNGIGHKTIGYLNFDMFT